MKPRIIIKFSWRQLEEKAAPIYKLLSPDPSPIKMNRWYSCAESLFTDLKKQLH